MNKKAQLSAIIAMLTTFGAIATIIIIVLFIGGIAGLIAFIYKSWTWLLGSAIIILSLIYGIKSTLDKPTNTKLILMLVFIVVGLFLILAPKIGLFQQTIISTDYQTSIIQCNSVQDCITWSLNKGVSQSNLDTIDFKCINNLCEFKQK